MIKNLLVLTTLMMASTAMAMDEMTDDQKKEYQRLSSLPQSIPDTSLTNWTDLTNLTDLTSLVFPNLDIHFGENFLTGSTEDGETDIETDGEDN